MLKNRLSKKNKEEGIRNATNNVPTVSFEDARLELIVGQWLGILPAYKSIGGEDLSIMVPLDEGELAKKAVIPRKQLENIELAFGEVLKKAGIDQNEVCALYNFDREKMTFKCHLGISDKEASIQLEWGDMIDTAPTLIIALNGVTKTYEYYAGTRRMYLSRCVRVNETGCEYSRNFEIYRAYFNLENSQFRLSLEVKRPYGVEGDYTAFYSYSLEKEREIEEYLSSLSLPIQIQEVYRHIHAIMGDAINAYPTFGITIEKCLENGEHEMIEEVFLSYGELENFMVTNEDRSIAFNKDGDWTYRKGKLTVRKENVAINYYLDSIEKAEDLREFSPYEEYDEAKTHVEKAKTMTMQMLDKKN